MSIPIDQIRSMRLGMDLTQAEAAAVAKVSPRTWAAWEGGSRPMPYSALDLFVLRITHSASELEEHGISIKEETRSMVVLMKKDEHKAPIPADVIARDNFLELKTDANDPKNRIVSSLAVSAQGKPYVHRTSVCRLLNAKQLEILERWGEEMNQS